MTTQPSAPQSRNPAGYANIGVTKLIKLECYKAQEGEGAGGLRVLIAEDEPGMARLVGSILEDIGHEVVAVARDGEEAVAMAIRRRPDLILMDIGMPLKDGITAAEEILSHYACAMLFTTGLADEATLKRAEKVNVQAYLVKPFKADQLRTAIQLAMAQHRKSLANEVEMSVLRSELDSAKALDQAVDVMIKRYGIGREEAIEQIEAMARGRKCSLGDAARQTVELLGRMPPPSMGGKQG